MMKIIGGSVLGVAVIMCAYLFYVWCELQGWKNGAEMGNTLSGLEAIFSGFALIGIVITIYVQYQELRDTRAELRRTADAQLKQAASLKAVAKLYGLSAMLQYYNSPNKLSEMDGIESFRVIKKTYKDEVNAILDEIEQIIAGK